MIQNDSMMYTKSGKPKYEFVRYNNDGNNDIVGTTQLFDVLMAILLTPKNTLRGMSYNKQMIKENIRKAIKADNGNSELTEDQIKRLESASEYLKEMEKKQNSY